MRDQPIVVLITVPSEEAGRQIAEALLAARLAACINFISPVNSLYTWNGNIQNDREVLLVVKSRAGLFEDRLLPLVKKIHPYQVPEIIAMPVLMGLPEYIKWIDESTTPVSG